VNGVVAEIDDGGNFYASVPVIAGSNALTATLTTPTDTGFEPVLQP